MKTATIYAQDMYTQAKQYIENGWNYISNLYRQNQLLFYAGGMTVIAAVLYVYLKNYYLSNPDERRIVQSLHPELRSTAKKFLNTLQQNNIGYEVISGFRTFPEQAELYKQGRSIPGNIVTRAKAGESYHNYGLAIDVIPEDWNNVHRIANIAESFGFEWGGDWDDFKDYPHFQKRFGYHWSDLLEKRNTGNVNYNGYVKL